MMEGFVEVHNPTSGSKTAVNFAKVAAMVLEGDGVVTVYLVAGFKLTFTEKAASIWDAYALWRQGGKP